jgi:hypothetical protein
MREAKLSPGIQVDEVCGATPRPNQAGSKHKQAEEDPSDAHEDQADQFERFLHAANWHIGSMVKMHHQRPTVAGQGE